MTYNEQNGCEYFHELSGWRVRFKPDLTFGEVIALTSATSGLLANNDVVCGPAFVQLGATLEQIITEIQDKEGNPVPLNDVPFGHLMVLLPHVIGEIVTNSIAGLPSAN